MTRYDRRTRLLAASLSGLAGFVDAVGFLASGGFFISFMSGNSTKLGVGIAAVSVSAMAAGALILSFLGGVVFGSLIGCRFDQRRLVAVLGLVALLLLLAALTASQMHLADALILAAMAMGAENAVFEDEGEIRIGLTYMTGTLVKLGQRLAAAMRGGDTWGWLPYLFQWAGLLLGAVAGGCAYARLGSSSLWIASAASFVLLAAAWLLERMAATATGTDACA